MSAGLSGSSAAPDPQGDRELVLAFQGGDENSYEQIYRRHGARVQHVCRRILGNGQDADEAAQEVFLRAYVALGRFNGQYQLGAWLARIAANVCFDQLRQRSRSVRTTELGGEAAAIETTDLGGSVGEQMTIGDTMKDMAPLHGQALFLRAVEGLSHNEIAERLQMSPSQVKALLHRARVSFKKGWQNASGWSVAALWLVRDRVREFVVETPQVAASAGPQLSLAAERVATSAVVVALALSGVSGGGVGGSQRPAPDPQRRVHEVAGQKGAHRQLPDVASKTAPAALTAPAAHGSRGENRHAAERKSPQLVAGVELPIDLPEVKARKKQETEERETRDEKPDEDPIPAPARPVVKKVEEVVEDLPPR